MAQSYFTEVTISGDILGRYPYCGYNVECHGTFNNSTTVQFDQGIISLTEHQVYQLMRDIKRARRLFRAAQKADKRS